MKTVQQRNKKCRAITNMRRNSDKIRIIKQIILRKIIIIATIISLSGFCIPANSQENSVSVKEKQSNVTQSKNLFSKDFNETSFLEQILIGIIPILIGMGSMALFTFLLTFLSQYSINRLVNLQKSLQDVTSSLEKKKSSQYSRNMKAGRRNLGKKYRWDEHEIPMSKTPQTTNEFKFLGAFASLVGLFSIALYFTGWVYRWAYYGFFRIELNALNLPAQSFFFVSIQVFLGSFQAFFHALLALIITVVLIQVTLWLLLPSTLKKTSNLIYIKSSDVNRSRLPKLISPAQWFITKLRYGIAQVFPSPLLKDLVIVAWVLVVLFWVSKCQGEADARRAAFNNTSTLPVVTLVHPEKGLGLGRNPQDLFTDPTSKKTRVIGDVGLFNRIQAEATNDTAKPNQPTSWRLLVNSNGWLYIFRTFPKNADAKRQPLVLAIQEGGNEQMMILSPLTSDSQSP